MSEKSTTEVHAATTLAAAFQEIRILGSGMPAFILPEGYRDWDATSTSYGETLADAVLPIGWDMPTFGDRRRELVKGAAMALAEIERLDRAAQKGSAA